MNQPSLAPEDIDILTVLSQHPEGIGISGILAALPQSVTKRTLQRRLRRLLQERHITSVGRGRAMIYKLLAPIDIYAKSSENEDNELLVYIPIAEDTRDVFEYIRRPQNERKHIGYLTYHREFLSHYEPNKTEYLSKYIRNYLQYIGSSKEHSRPAGTFGREILNQLLIDLSWSSSRLEGNTYSRLDTERLIELGKEAEGKNIQETQMILNHKAAIELLVNEAEHLRFDKATIFSLHGLLSENLLSDPDASGRLRSSRVNIGGSVYKPLVIPQLIEEIFNEILDKVEKIKNPFEQAFFIMVHIPYLQPFLDVNKRVARLAANIPFIKENLCPLTFVQVPERVYIDAYLGIYELNRIELLRDLFVWAYEHSVRKYLVAQKSLAEPNIIRLKYRDTIHMLIGEIVKKCLDNITAHIENFSKKHIPHKDRKQFKEIVLDDLKRLHEGVLARYKLSLSDFEKWKNRSKNIK